MSGNVPQVAGSTTVGVITASQLPNTGPAELIVQIAAFSAVVMVSWYVAGRLFSRV